MSRPTAGLALTSLLLAVALSNPQPAFGRPDSRRDLKAAATRQIRSSTPVSFYDQVDEATEEPPIGCGYPSCPKIDPTKLNVHVIAHTHDDVGWLKTVDQYFYGTNKQFSKIGVENILDSLIPVLALDKSKRFVYVEMSFFVKWWNEQDERIKSIVKQLVAEGRLEFINGGWCMNDEATVTYHSTIEQMTLGLKFLNDTFGSCGHPKVGWQIDPFGHSNEQASLFAQFGFDGMFFSRIGYRDKMHRTAGKSLDLIWHGDRALPGQTGSIFTNIFRDHYELGLYCFDVQCEDDAVVDNRKSFEYNVDKLSNRLIDYARSYAQSKLTNNILIPFGGDFHFSAAGQNFRSFDRLIKYVQNNTSDINIFYSTPSCYQLAVHESLRTAPNLSLPEKYDDFMPYDSSPTVWWSGYFTSRPSVKLIERKTAKMLQVIRQISLANLINKARNEQFISSDDWIKEVEAHEYKCLTPMWEILGDLQHHDAVTGTEKQHVTDDYECRVSEANRQCAKFITAIRRQQIESRLKKSSKFEALKQTATKMQLDPIYLEDTMFCQSLNISQCEALESDVDVLRYTQLKVVRDHIAAHNRTGGANLSRSVPYKTMPFPKELETKSILLTVYNPLSRPVTQVDIRLPCNGNCDLDKVQVIHLASNQTIKLIRLPLPAGISKLPYRESRTNHEFLFYADIPALGSASFVIGDENSDQLIDEELSDEAVIITDESLRQNQQNVVRGRRIQRDTVMDYMKSSSAHSSPIRHDDEEVPHSDRHEYITMNLSGASNSETKPRSKRDAGSLSSQQTGSDRVVLKFDMRTGVITGLRRVVDGSILNITQKFGQYFPANFGHRPGAYIFRPNSSEPVLFDKPIAFKMYKRQGGGLIEIHQKWADWIFQTIRVDSKKNYIEFDYVVGPIPVYPGFVGREIVTRYITNMANDGVFLTDSNARQLLPRRRLNSTEPAQTGGNFYPVTSTMIIRNNKASRSNVSAEAVAVLVDRAQAGTSLNEGDLELLIHRRQLQDDAFGVSESLNEPGEDGRGLVTRGKHRLFLKFQDLPKVEREQGGSRQKSSQTRQQQPLLLVLSRTPKENLTYEKFHSPREVEDNYEPLRNEKGQMSTYIVYDQLYNDIRQESIKFALKPLLTFDRLRVSANEFVELLHSNNVPKTDQTLMNNTLPSNVHVLTLQPWNKEVNQLLLRFENLDNPLTIHSTPDEAVYESLLRSYEMAASKKEQVLVDDACNTRSVKPVEIDIEYMLRNIRITTISELNLGANAKLSEDKRLDWTEEQAADCKTEVSSTTSIKLGPRQIKTFLATFEFL